MYDAAYCARGETGNRIREQQPGLSAGRTGCRKFVANQFRLLPSSFAYGLIEPPRRTAPAGTGLARATTIRTKRLKIGAVVVSSVRRRLVPRRSSASPPKGLSAQAARRLVGRVQRE